MKRRWGCGVIRVICVIRLIRDSDTGDVMDTHMTQKNKGPGSQ